MSDLLQQALEALKETRRVDDVGREPETHWESLRHLRRNVIAMQDAAVAALESALRQQISPLPFDRHYVFGYLSGVLQHGLETGDEDIEKFADWLVPDGERDDSMPSNARKEKS